eukprot:TRINITY_DN1936_c1_g1_i1.p1 TRINITY_DN1936_c1_g1~~TRINITY_DN1936_c1_g1_i1.p1  ORF type:complete len:311 (-),score=121.08 TRINITY_DN1936_c1_g1_i1:24-956(-)
MSAEEIVPAEGDVVEFASGRAGYLYLKTGKKKFKFTWMALAGSNLYAYKDAKATTPSTVYKLKDHTVEDCDDRDFAFTVKDPSGSVAVTLGASGVSDKEQWVEVLSSNFSQEGLDPPDKQKMRSKGKFFRASKAIAGKAAVSGIGKSGMKQAVPDELRELISALKHIVAKVETPKKADEIEEHLIKILLKVFFLERNGDLTMDDILRADAPLREAFELLIEMRDYQHRMTPERLASQLKGVHVHIAKVEAILSEMLAPHLSGNTIKRIGVTFGLLGSHEFLASGWSSDQFEDERNLLTDAMLRYTAFHFQ